MMLCNAFWYITLPPTPNRLVTSVELFHMQVQKLGYTQRVHPFRQFHLLRPSEAFVGRS